MKNAPTSEEMKLAALKWLRFGRQCFAVATEFGNFSADVIGLNAKSLYEIEVKRSKSDFLADFKKGKHRLYGSSLMSHCPNYLYFLVPLEMVDWAVLKMREIEAPYGVMAYGKYPAISVARRCKRMKTTNRGQVEIDIMLRMGSDYLNIYDRWLDDRKDLDRLRVER